MVFRQPLKVQLDVDAELGEQGAGGFGFVAAEIAQAFRDVLLGELGSCRGAGGPISTYETFPDLVDGLFSLGAAFASRGITQLVAQTEGTELHADVFGQGSEVELHGDSTFDRDLHHGTFNFLGQLLGLLHFGGGGLILGHDLSPGF